MKYIHPRRFLRSVIGVIYNWFWYYCVPDKWEIIHAFKNSLGCRPNLNQPKSFNEKIQWLKLHDRKPMYTSLIDKFQAKQIVANIIGEEHIIPTLLGPFYDVNEVPWDNLPNQCVIKCNHDAASVIFCQNRKDLNVKNAKTKLSACLNRNYYHYVGKQWGYKDINPCIFVEQLMKNGDKAVLEDYKFMMFNGKCRCIFTCSDRYSKEGMKLNFYSPDWQLLPFTRSYPNTSVPLSPPKQLSKMLEIAEKLAAYVNNPFVRVDLYEINAMVYFSELTFYPGGGLEAFQPIEWDYILGSWIDLTKGVV